MVEGGKQSHPMEMGEGKQRKRKRGIEDHTGNIGASLDPYSILHNILVRKIQYF